MVSGVVGHACVEDDASNITLTRTSGSAILMTVEILSHINCICVHGGALMMSRTSCAWQSPFALV